MIKEYFPGIKDAHTALKIFIQQNDNRSTLFNDSDTIKAIIRDIEDLDKLYAECRTLFDVNPEDGLKLMFLVYFEDTPYRFGNHHVFDGISLYMCNFMNDNLCHYIKSQWTTLKNTLSIEDQEWWMRECTAWGCPL